MSAFDSRPTTRGDRLETSKKYSGTDCPHALRRRHREGERERWGYHPVRPTERVDVRTAYALLAELEEPSVERRAKTKVDAVQFTAQNRTEAMVTTDFAQFMAANDAHVDDDDYMGLQDYFLQSMQSKEVHEPFVGRMVGNCFVCD